MNELKLGDKIRIIDDSIFSIDENIDEGEYAIVEFKEDLGYYRFEVNAKIGGSYLQSFNEQDIGRYVEKVVEND